MLTRTEEPALSGPGTGAGENLARLQAALLKFLRQYASELEDPSFLGASESPSKFSLQADSGGYRYALTREPSPQDDTARTGMKLTPREQQIEGLATQGLPTKVIAQRLHITTGTLAVHFRHIYSKRCVHSRLALIYKLRAGS